MFEIVKLFELSESLVRLIAGRRPDGERGLDRTEPGPPTVTYTHSYTHIQVHTHIGTHTHTLIQVQTLPVMH